MCHWERRVKVMETVSPEFVKHVRTACHPRVAITEEMREAMPVDKYLGSSPERPVGQVGKPD